MNSKPRRRESRVECSTTGSPSISTVPWSGACAPARILTSVDLPAPLAPTKPCTSPLRKATDTLFKAVMAPNLLVTPVTLTRGGATSRPNSAHLERVGVLGDERVVVVGRHEHRWRRHDLGLRHLAARLDGLVQHLRQG